MARATLVTADELLAMCGDERYELVRGVLVPMSPPPGFRHGRLIINLTLPIVSFARAQNLGDITAAETGYRLRRNPDTVRAPDLAFVARGRITADMDQTRYLDLAPDLVVEVVSPSDSAADINAKVLEYLDAGVRLIWIVYPETETVAVYRPEATSRLLGGSDQISGDQLSGEDVLPGFTFPITGIFAGPESA